MKQKKEEPGGYSAKRLVLNSALLGGALPVVAIHLILFYRLGLHDSERSRIRAKLPYRT